jgi:hypothetical protein
MSGWKAVWAIARSEWKRERYGMLFTLLFALYGGGLCGFLLNALLGPDDAPSVLYVMVDWMYLMMLPVCGLLFNRTAWAISRDDVYTKKLAHWRTMPIPAEKILQARLLQGIILVLVIGFAFLMLQYAIAPALREQVSITQWLAVGTIWLGYALLINGFFIWIEMGCSGKRYVRLYLTFMIVTMVVPVSLTLGGFHLFRYTLREIEAGHYGWMLLGFAAAIAALYTGYRATLARMRKRSYIF